MEIIFQLLKCTRRRRCRWSITTLCRFTSIDIYLWVFPMKFQLRPILAAQKLSDWLCSSSLVEVTWLCSCPDSRVPFYLPIKPAFLCFKNWPCPDWIDLLGRVLWHCDLFWLTFPWNATTIDVPVLRLPWLSIHEIRFRHICCRPASEARCLTSPFIVIVNCKQRHWYF